jgi:signal transduction histidine kinase
MYSATGERMRSAAWRISLWGALWFACGTAVVFLGLHHLIASDLEQRDDVWLEGEVQTISDTLKTTPKGEHYADVAKERAELAGDEVPEPSGQRKSTFFVETTTDGAVSVWTGDVDEKSVVREVIQAKIATGALFNIPVPGHGAPYRVAWRALPDGGRIYLGLSERDERHTLEVLGQWFLIWGLINVLLGSSILFAITRGTLRHVRNMTLTASRIGEANLAERVPVSERHDEVAELAINLNRMLDRVERGVGQLRTITGALAHDLRSPLTAIRARLEMAATERGDSEAVVAAIEELDRLNEMLTQSLDVAEAQAGALRIDRRLIDLAELLEMMVELYQPSMQERGLSLQWSSTKSIEVSADRGLVHRLLANLFENEVKHVPAGHKVFVSLRRESEMAVVTVEDDGLGLPDNLMSEVFLRGVKGEGSKGYGLGLAFIEAVATAHGGWARAGNRPEGGACLRVALPAAPAATR